MAPPLKVPVEIAERSALAPARGWLPRLYRGLMVLAAVLFGLELLYIVAVNAFLNFGFGLLFQGTNSINTTLGRAWTVWPGTAHVRDVRVVFQDHNLQWTLDVAQATVEVELLPLVRRTFHATSLVGEGTVFRMRHRVDPWSVHEPPMSALTQIPEFPGPAVFEARAPEAPLTDAEYNLWTVHMENVDAGVREAWVQQFRYVGGGRVRGAFRLRPARTLWVGPGLLDLDGGRLTVGSFLVSPALTGHVDVVVHPFDVRKPEGRAVLRFISAGVNLRATDVSLQASQLFEPAVRLMSAGGDLLIAARTDHGMLVPDSKFELRQRGLRVEHAAFESELERAELVAKALSAGGEATLTATGAKVRLPEASAPPFSVETFRASAQSSSADTTADWQLEAVELMELRASVSDARWFDPLTRKSGLRALGGTAAVTARGSYRQGALEGDMHTKVEKLRIGSGTLELAIDGEAHASASRDRGTSNAKLHATFTKLGARAGSMRLDTRGTLDGDVRRWDLERRTGSLTLAAALSKIRFRTSDGPLQGGADNFSLSSRLQARAGGALDAVLYSTARGVNVTHGTLRFRGSSEFNLDARGFDSERNLGRVSANITVSDFSAYDENADPDCPWSQAARASVHTDARFLGKNGSEVELSAALESARLAWGDLDTSLAKARLDAKFEGRVLSEQRGKVFATLSVDQATLASGTGAPNGWEAAVPHATYRAELFRQPGNLGGKMSVEASDVRARLGRTPFRVDVSSDIPFASLDIDKQHVTGYGSVHLRRLVLPVKDERIEDWWADVKLGYFDVRAKQTLETTATFQATLRDALPALNVLADQGDLPGFVPGLFPLRDLEAHGSLRRRCQLTEFRVDAVSGGPFVGGGRLQSVPEAVRGAFLVQLAAFEPLSAGIHFDGDDSGVSLLAGSGWLKAQYEPLERRSDATDQTECVPPPRECPK